MIEITQTSAIHTILHALHGIHRPTLRECMQTMGALCFFVLCCFGISVHALIQGVTLFSDLGVILLVFFPLLGVLFSLHIYVECKEQLIFHPDYIRLQKPDQTWTIPVDTIRALGTRRLTFILLNGDRRWIICTKHMQHTIENTLMNVDTTFIEYC